MPIRVLHGKVWLTEVNVFLGKLETHHTYKLQPFLHAHGILGLQDMPNSNPRIKES